MSVDITSLIMPRFYHYRGKNESDRSWIAARMAVIPKDKQQEVALEYEKKFSAKNRTGRRIANEYLHAVASEYRNQRRG